MSPSSNDPAQRRALLIVNPFASRSRTARTRAEAVFKELGVPWDVYTTTAPGDAAALAREHQPRYTMVFVIGGDGTVVEVIAALAGTAAVGIVAGGTGNLLARSFGIPLDAGAAVRALLEGVETRLDLGQLDNGHHFAIGVGVGLDEEMIAGASSDLKRRLGVYAYAWSAFKAGLRLTKFHARVTVDGKPIDRSASAVLVANLGAVVNGLIHLGNGIQHDDGLLDVCIYSPRNFIDALRIFIRMLRGTAHLDSHVTCVAGRDFMVETTPSRRSQADGELLGPTPIRVRVVPGAGRILIPRVSSSPRSS